MSNLVTEVDRAIEFERITKQAHEANLQALRDGKIIGQSDFLKLVDIEPKLRWMNENLKRWATGTTQTTKTSTYYRSLYNYTYGGDTDSKKNVLKLPQLSFNPKYVVIPSEYIVAYNNISVAVHRTTNWDSEQHLVPIENGFKNNVIYVGVASGNLTWYAFE